MNRVQRKRSHFSTRAIVIGYGLIIVTGISSFVLVRNYINKLRLENLREKRRRS